MRLFPESVLSAPLGQRPEGLGLEAGTDREFTLQLAAGASLTWAARRHPCPLTVLGSFASLSPALGQACVCRWQRPCSPGSQHQTFCLLPRPPTHPSITQMSLRGALGTQTKALWSLALQDLLGGRDPPLSVQGQALGGSVLRQRAAWEATGRQGGVQLQESFPEGLMPSWPCADKWGSRRV